MGLNYEDWICSGCGKGHDEPNAKAGPIEERYSLDIYAGRYHDKCWNESGYRKEGASAFDPTDAGESYDEI